MRAIKAGIFCATTKAELLTAEAAVTAARAALAAVPEEAAAARAGVRAVAELEEMVAALPAMLGKDADRAREILRRLVGVVRLVREKGGLFAELSTAPGRLLPLASPNGSGGTLREFPTIASSLIWPVEFVDSGPIHQSPTVVRLLAGLSTNCLPTFPSARTSAGAHGLRGQQLSRCGSVGRGRLRDNRSGSTRNAVNVRSITLERQLTGDRPVIGPGADVQSK
jgi:hypothetical protein